MDPPRVHRPSFCGFNYNLVMKKSRHFHVPVKNYAGFGKASLSYPLVSCRESRRSAVGEDISQMSWIHHHDPRWGFFGFYVMFKNFNFQTFNLGEGGGIPSCVISSRP